MVWKLGSVWLWSAFELSAGLSDVVFGVVQSNIGASLTSTWNRVKGYAIR